MEEIWKDVKGFEGRYLVSNTGKIYSILAKRILKTCISNKGYELACLRNEKGYRKQYTVHRLVAMSFLDNPNNYPIINHKDENKLNNNIDNLEWCTIDYNNNYGTRTQRTRKKICQYDTNYKLIKIWDGIRVASRELNIPSQQISQCCKKSQYRHTAGGYIWEYLNQKEVT